MGLLKAIGIDGRVDRVVDEGYPHTCETRRRSVDSRLIPGPPL